MAESLFLLRVIEVKDGAVVLKGFRSTLCGRCACSSVTTTEIIWEIRMETPKAFPVGTQVRLEIAPREFLLGVTTLYVLPLLFLFGGYAIGFWMGPRLGISPLSVWWQLLSSGFGLVLAFPVMHWFDCKLGSRPGFRPHLVRTVSIRSELLNPRAVSVDTIETCDGLETARATTEPKRHGKTEG